MRRPLVYVCVACLLTGLGSIARAQPQPTLRIVFEGHTGGVSSGATRMNLASVLFDETVVGDGQVRIAASGFGALYDSGRYLFLPDGGPLSTLLGVVRSQPVERLESVDVEALVGRYSVNVLGPVGALDVQENPADDRLLALLSSTGVRAGRFRDIHQEGWRLTRVRGQNGQEAILLESPQASPTRPLDIQVDLWEVRFLFEYEVAWPEGGTARLVTLERRIGGGSRRYRWVQEQLAELDDRAIFVSAGNSVEGRSWLENTPLNLQRPHSWAGLRAVPLSVLVPGHLELAGGVANLVQEAETAGVTLVGANLASGETGELLFQPSTTRTLGGIRVAFIGLTGPEVQTALPPEMAAEIEVLDPAASLADEIARLRTDEEGEPDLVVVLSAMSEDQLRDILDEVVGVDVAVGPFTPAAARDVDDITRLVPGSAPSEVPLRDRVPVVMAPTNVWQVGRMDIFTSGHTVTEVRVVSRAVDQDWEPLSPFINGVNQVRHDVYTAGERILFPDLNRFIDDSPEVAEVYLRYADVPVGMSAETYFERYPVVFSRGVWLNYLSNTLRNRLNADVAMVRVLPAFYTIAGPVSQILIDAFIGVLDEIVVYSIPGKVLTELLDARGTLRQHPELIGDPMAPPAVSGVLWSEEEVGGREVDPEATYRVVMTDHLAAQPDYAEILEGYEPDTRFVIEENGEVEDEGDGEPLRLHRLAIEDLERRAEANPAFDADYWAALVPVLADQGGELLPQFVFRIEQIALLLSRVGSAGDRRGYDQVRNTRVLQEDSLAYNGIASLSAAFDTPNVISTLGAFGKFGEVRIGGETSETADDLYGYLDFQLRFLEIDFARSLRPYLTSRYDTEFTPGTDDAGNELSRQSQLRDSVGLRADFSDIVPELRVGFFNQIDFAASTGRSEWGPELILRERIDTDHVDQRFDLSGAYFIPTDEDTPEDLAFTIDAVFSVAFTVVGNLKLSMYADLFVFQGKLPENDQVGLSAIVGVGLSYDAVFRTRL